MQPLRGSGQVYLTCGFDPDGRLFAAGGIGPVVDLWDTTDPGTPVRQLGERHPPVVHLALLGGGRLLAVTARAGLRLVSAGADVLLAAGGRVPWADRAAVSAGGIQLATAGEQLVVWEVGDGIHPLWSIGVARMGPLYAGVAFDPVGSRLAASRIRPGPAVHDYGGPVEPAVEVYRIVGRSAAELPAGLVTEVPVRGARPDRLAWSPDGALLAGLVDKHLTVWETATWSEVFGPPADPGPGEWLTVLFHPGGRLLLTGGAAGTVGVWDVASWSPVSTFRWGTGPVYALAVAPDGLRAAAAGQGGAVIWDLDA